MKYLSYNDITVVVILYNTPLKKIINLKQYENFKLIILEQGSSTTSKKKIKEILGFKFQYYYSKKNLGLAKGINFLIKKTKTKYCLITEPDVFIEPKSIIKLKKTILFNKNYLLVGPSYNKKLILKKSKITKNIDLSCVFFETKKLIKFNFYDENFFFFWTDIDLIKRVNNSNFKMVIAKNSFAKHNMSSSSDTLINVNYLRDKSFKYGELIFDYKYNNLRFLKISRQLFQNLLSVILNLILFNQKKIIRNIGYTAGIVNFCFFYFKKKFKVLF